MLEGSTDDSTAVAPWRRKWVWSAAAVLAARNWLPRTDEFEFSANSQSQLAAIACLLRSVRRSALRCTERIASLYAATCFRAHMTLPLRARAPSLHVQCKLQAKVECTDILRSSLRLRLLHYSTLLASACCHSLLPGYLPIYIYTYTNPLISCTC